MTAVHAIGEFWSWARGRRRRLRVEGESMMPTLVAGQFVLFEPGGRFEAGDVVLARHPTQGIDLVKRVISVESVGLVQLGSDNAEAGTDSRSFGRIDIDHVVGRVTISLEWPFPLVGRR